MHIFVLDLLCDLVTSYVTSSTWNFTQSCKLLGSIMPVNFVTICRKLSELWTFECWWNRSSAFSPADDTSASCSIKNFLVKKCYRRVVCWRCENPLWWVFSPEVKLHFQCLSKLLCWILTALRPFEAEKTFPSADLNIGAMDTKFYTLAWLNFLRTISKFQEDRIKTACVIGFWSVNFQSPTVTSFVTSVV